METFKFVSNVIGLILTIYGTRTTYSAMKEDYRQFSSDPLVKAPGRVRTFVAVLFYRATGRKPPTQTIRVGTAHSTETAGSIHIVQTGPAIPDEISLEEKVTMLTYRVVQIEEQAARDRALVEKQNHQRDQDFQHHAELVRQQINRIDGTIAETAIGSLPKQVRGLALVAVGALFAALADTVPPIVDFFSR